MIIILGYQPLSSMFDSYEHLWTNQHAQNHLHTNGTETMSTWPLANHLRSARYSVAYRWKGTKDGGIDPHMAPPCSLQNGTVIPWHPWQPVQVHALPAIFVSSPSHSSQRSAAPEALRPQGAFFVRRAAHSSSEGWTSEARRPVMARNQLPLHVVTLAIVRYPTDIERTSVSYLPG